MGIGQRKDDDDPMTGPSGPIRDDGGTPAYIVVIYLVILAWAALAWIWPAGP